MAFGFRIYDLGKKEKKKENRWKQKNNNEKLGIYMDEKS